MGTAQNDLGSSQKKLPDLFWGWKREQREEVARAFIAELANLNDLKEKSTTTLSFPDWNDIQRWSSGRSSDYAKLIVWDFITGFAERFARQTGRLHSGQIALKHWGRKNKTPWQHHWDQPLTIQS